VLELGRDFAVGLGVEALEYFQVTLLQGVHE
jgi:hypothetical protein